MLLLIINFFFSKCSHANASEETDQAGKTWKWCRACGARYNPNTGEWEE